MEVMHQVREFRNAQVIFKLNIELIFYQKIKQKNQLVAVLGEIINHTRVLMAYYTNHYKMINSFPRKKKPTQECKKCISLLLL